MRVEQFLEHFGVILLNYKFTRFELQERQLNYLNKFVSYLRSTKTYFVHNFPPQIYICLNLVNYSIPT